MKAVGKDFLRENNRKLALNVIHQHSPLSRTQIVNETGLNKVTISRVVNGLIKKGLVREGEPTASNGGRPQVMIRLVPDSRYAIGIDVGIYHVKAGICDLSGSVVLDITKEIASPLTGNGLIWVIEGAVAELLEKSKVKKDKLLGAGVSILGAVYADKGIIKSSFILSEKDVALKDGLEEKLKMDVLVDRDANAGLFYERFMGKGKDADDILFVYTRNNEKGELGIGCSLLLGGRIYRGTNYFAGEIGLARGAEDEISRLFSFDGTASLLDAAVAGKVGEVIAFIVNLLNPKLVIIGGDFSAAGQKFLDPVEESARRHIFDFSTKNIRIESSKVNGDSGIKAAAFMAIAVAMGYK